MSSPQSSHPDSHFAGFLMDLAEKPCPELHLAARLVSRQISLGHICLDLDDIDESEQIFPGNGDNVFADSSLHEKLYTSGVVGVPGEWKPLVLDPPLLYLQRFWQYERAVADFILKQIVDCRQGLDEQRLCLGLDRMFAENRCEDGETDWQKEAARKALMRKFCIITGGPGTGKTTTVARVLALFVEYIGGDNTNILLAAPTGKAAARLQEAIIRAKASLQCSAALKEAIPEKAVTLHRLLGWSKRGWRYNRSNPLPASLVVVDEASMVDLPLMAALMHALPLRSSLVLLGDRNQLGSVQPGAVLGDICRGLSRTGSASLAELKKSYRFASDSGIGRLSNTLKHGDGEAALEVLLDGRFDDVVWHDIDENIDSFRNKMRRFIRYHHKKITSAQTPAEALGLLGEFVILTALRKGPFGAESINATFGGIDADRHSVGHFHGRPVLVSRNQYSLRLYNGDVGLLLRDGKDGDLRVFFQQGTGVRKLLPARLPQHETAFALTVHKSQGSEFDHVVLVLPPEASPVLCRELIYTGVTRAAKSVEIWGNRNVFMDAVAVKTKRRSGLVKALRMLAG